MLTRFATALPLGALDVWFAHALTRLSPRISAQACQVGCFSIYACGQCGCPGQPGWCLGTRYCDSCNGQDCGCSGCPPPGGPC